MSRRTPNYIPLVGLAVIAFGVVSMIFRDYSPEADQAERLGNSLYEARMERDRYDITAADTLIPDSPKVREFMEKQRQIELWEAEYSSIVEANPNALQEVHNRKTYGFSIMGGLVITALGVFGPALNDTTS